MASNGKATVIVVENETKIPIPNISSTISIPENGNLHELTISAPTQLDVTTPDSCPCENGNGNMNAAVNGAASVLASASGGGWFKAQTSSSSEQKLVVNGDQWKTSTSSDVSIGTSKQLSCHKQSESNDFRIQLYILLGIGTLFVLWAVLYFPLTHRS